MRAILTFHDLSTRAGPLAFAPAHFEALLDAIARRGWQVVPLEALVEEGGGDGLGGDGAGSDGGGGDGGDGERVRDAAGNPARPRVALTFDDGLLSVRDEALPRLAARGLPASCFVVTDFVGRDNAWPGQPAGAPRMATLDWDALGALAQGGIRIENHTRTHPDLRGLSAAALADEIDAAGAEIERHLGRAPRALAYPYGFYDDAVLAATRARGLIGVTTDMGWLRGEPRWRLPRLETCYIDGARRAAAWGTRRLGAYLALRGALRAVGRRVRGT